MTLHLLAFGAPTVRVDGETRTLPFERRSQLLAFLALRRAWVGRAELAALLWPDLERPLAYANLRKTLFRLQALPWGRGIEAREGAVRARLRSDVEAFDDAINAGRHADALGLYGGELLAGFDEDGNEPWSNWLRFERERLRDAWRSAALERLGQDLESGEALALAARLVEADPLDEAAVSAQITWLARSGQGARARETYRAFAVRLEQDLGLSPGVGLAALHASLAAGATARPAVASAWSPGNDGFVGRSAELRAIGERLAQRECRLLCLIGPGGVGKTRLARRAMQELASRFADGATFVPLEDVEDAAAIGARLARELGVRLTGRSAALPQVQQALRDREMLVVMDNFEHLAHHAPTVEQLLAAAPGVKVLATSRVRLATVSEWALPLAGLPCPEAEDADRLETFDAARLFVSAAQRAGPGLVPAAEAAAIADICRHVEGLPLALELAAAWTRVLSCAAIADELRRGADLLRTVDATHPPRHASLEHVFEQSWQLLAPAEREALARLSVFRAGFLPTAAQAVAAVPLPVLGALVDKSLLRKDGARLDMHPLVQQFAALRLDGPERAATEEAHARHFHRLLAQTRRAVDDGDREALRAIEADFENARAAWRWAIAGDAGGALAASAPTLMHFCDHRARFAEGAALLAEAVDTPAATADPALRARLLAAVAHLEYRVDRYDLAMSTARRALGDAQRVRDRDAQLQCLKVLGACSLRLGRHDDARRYFGQALRHAPAGTDPHNAAAMLDHLALVAKYTGDYDEALRLALRSLEEHRRLGDAAGEALCLNNVAALYLDWGQHDAAAAHLKAGLDLATRHGFVTTRALILTNLTELAMKTGDLHRADAYARDALDVARAVGFRAAIVMAHLRFAQMAVRRGDLATARLELAEGVSVARSVDREGFLIAGVGCFAELLAAQGEMACARLVLGFAADHPAASAPEREEMRARLARWPATPHDPAAWPGIALAELVDRIVAEAPVAHRPLVEALRGGRG